MIQEMAYEKKEKAAKGSLEQNHVTTLLRFHCKYIPDR